MSAVIISVLRLNRSTKAPAIGPNSRAGNMRAAMTPATAYAPPASPPLLATRAATATNPTQSPNELTVCAISSLLNAGWVMRSLKVAGRVPRSRATSSAKLDTYDSGTGLSATAGSSTGVCPSGLGVGAASPACPFASPVARALAGERFAAVFRVVVERLAVVFFFVVRLAVDLLVVRFFLAAARAARAAALAARASASASGSPGLVTLNASSISAPQPQHRML